MNDRVMQRVTNAISKSEEMALRIIKPDDFMVPFLQCVREYDFESVVHETLRQQSLSPSHSEITNWLYFQYGLPRLVQLYHQFDRPNRDGIHYVSTPELRDYARRILYSAGYTEYVRRALYMAEDGLIRLEERNGIATFVFHRQHYDHLDSMAETQSRLNSYDAVAEALNDTLDDITPSIIQDVDKSVKLFQGRLIAYESTPLLDDYFMIRATTLALAMTDHDVFDPLAEFGGLPFEAYALAISMQTMFSLKHDLCIARLVSKHPKLSIPDCYTVTASRESILEGLSRGFAAYGRSNHLNALSNNRLALELILDVISAGRSTSRTLIGTNGVLPHLLEFTPKSFIRCRHGARQNPYAVLRRALARRFPSDYSKAQQRREGRQFEQLEFIITKRFLNTQMKSNIKLRKDKRVLTDLDVVLVDSVAGTIHFIQLKHQDPYGRDIRNRRQRAEKLVTEVNAWLSAVESWYQSANLERFLRDCGFKLSRKIEPLTLSIQVVSMHHAHFLSDCIGPEFKYETWHNYIETLKNAQSLQVAFESMNHSKSRQYGKKTWDRPFIVPDGKLEGVPIQFIDETGVA